jgi:hypothetical protein
LYTGSGQVLPKQKSTREKTKCDCHVVVSPQKQLTKTLLCNALKPPYKSRYSSHVLPGATAYRYSETLPLLALLSPPHTLPGKNQILKTAKTHIPMHPPGFHAFVRCSAIPPELIATLVPGYLLPAPVPKLHTTRAQFGTYSNPSVHHSPPTCASTKKSS